MSRARPLELVSPAGNPEGEERDRWPTGDKPMPDTQVVTRGELRDLMQGIRDGQARIEHNQDRAASNLVTALERFQEDEDKRHLVHDVRAEKNEKLLEMLSARVRDLESDKRLIGTLLTIGKWMIGTFGVSIITGMLMAWRLMADNAELLATLENAGKQRNQQQELIQQELGEIKRDLPK